MSLMDKLKKASKIKESDVLSHSKFFEDDEHVETQVPILNVALSGSIKGGLVPGLTMISGDSKHFKSNMALLMAAAYLDKYPDAMLLFFDSEFGASKEYFASLGIDTTRVLHTPVKNIEELKFDLVGQLEAIERGDKVVIVIDSIGNIASKKELEDAINEKSVADMTRAKSLKSLFRIVTPYLRLKSIPLIAINHVYDSQGLFSSKVVSGGTGCYLSSNTIFIIGRQQQKEGTSIKGYNFVINIEKSRFVREKSKLIFSVSWEGGIDKYSGLLEIALDGGWIAKPSQGWYCKVDKTTGELLEPKLRERQLHSHEFWNPILTDPKFDEFVKDRYAIALNNLLKKEEEIQTDGKDTGNDPEMDTAGSNE